MSKSKFDVCEKKLNRLQNMFMLVNGGLVNLNWDDNFEKDLEMILKIIKKRFYTEKDKIRLQELDTLLNQYCKTKEYKLF